MEWKCNKTILVAEAGLNHNGSLKTALDLIDAAADAGADVVKFQSLTAEGLMHSCHNAFDLIKKLELDRNAHCKLAERANERGIGFASTPFDTEWVEFLCELKPVFLKIASPDIITVPLLEKIGSSGQKVVLSTGLASLEEIEFGIRTLREAGLKKSQIVLLHCVSAYPTPLEAANLRAIRTLENRFGLPVGFSDHTEGIEAPVWAVASGACMIEKHFTLDKTMDGPDHAFSLSPDEFKRMAGQIRLLEKALGSGEKALVELERPIINAARRGLMTMRAIEEGHEFKAEDLKAVRPLPEKNGVSAREFRKVIRKFAAKDLPKNHLLLQEDWK